MTNQERDRVLLRMLKTPPAPKKSKAVGLMKKPRAAKAKKKPSG
jgi:hypothetical protein